MKKVKFLFAFVLLAVVLVLGPKVYAYTTGGTQTSSTNIITLPWHPGTPNLYWRFYFKETNETVFVFKGDNNNTVDRLRIRSSQIRGKQVYTLANFAGLFEFINSIYGTITLISILALLFVLENTFAYAINLKLTKLQSENSSENGESKLNDDLQPSG